MSRIGPTRLDPNSALDALQGNLARLVDHYWPGQPPRWAPTPPWEPPLDLYETPEGFELSVDLPGVAPTAVDLSIDGLVLTLRGERAAPPAAEAAATEPSERRSGPFRRQVALGGPIDVDAVRAELRDGVLMVHVPKLVPARTRTIPVQGS